MVQLLPVHVGGWANLQICTSTKCQKSNVNVHSALYMHLYSTRVVAQQHKWNLTKLTTTSST